MSLMEVRVKGTKERVPLGSLIHRLMSNPVHESIENQGDTPIYNMIQIVKPTDKCLGKGSTGTVYRARFLLSKRAIDCVVKFPNTLLRDECIVIAENGGITLNPHKKDEAKENRRQAIEELEIEWHNAFLLRFGKAMMDTRIAEPYSVSVASEAIQKAETETVLMQREWGYNQIHQLLAMDASVPCLISEHFEMAMLDWARKTKPSPQIINETVAPKMLAALHYMHNQGKLAHMDIKPNNMLYSPTTQRMVLSDFGASIPADVLCHTPKGTIGYVAPEVLAGAYTPRLADAYSFAVAMLHLMHPEIPCEFKNEQLVMLERVLLAVGNKGDVWAAIQKCKAPAERYALLSAQMVRKGLYIITQKV
jgi:serine/threonine protein kinase